MVQKYEKEHFEEKWPMYSISNFLFINISWEFVALNDFNRRQAASYVCFLLSFHVQHLPENLDLHLVDHLEQFDLLRTSASIS